jgi:tryptophan synthase alpha chain
MTSPDLAEVVTRGRFLVAYLTLGYPTPYLTKDYASALVKGGANVLELGIPPDVAIYDGLRIRVSYWRARESGVNLRRALKIAEEVREAPKIILSYQDLIRDMKGFMSEASNIGASAVLIPDLALGGLSRLELYVEASEMNGLEKVFFFHEGFPDFILKRMRELEPLFIYLGLSPKTGAHPYTDPIKSLRRVKSLVNDVPVAVGLGLRSTRQVEVLVKEGAEGIVVGSPIVEIAENNLHIVALKKIREFIDRLSRALRKS